MAPRGLDRLLAPYRAGIAGLDRRVLWVVSGTFLAVAARMSLITFLAIYFSRNVGLPLAVVGLGFVAENVGRGVFAPLAGALSDRIGRRLPLLVGVAGLMVVLPLFLVVHTPLQLIVWSLALGMFGAIQQPTSNALLLDLVPVSARQRVLALNYTAIALGYTLGVAPAGFLAQRSYAWLAIGSTALYAGVFLLYILGLRGPLPRQSAGPPPPMLRALAAASRDRAFLAFACVALIFPVALGLTTTTSTLFASDEGMTEGRIGVILSLNGLLLAFLALPVQGRIEKYGPFRLLGASALVLALSFLFLGFVPGITLALLLHVLAFTFGELTFGPAVPAAIASFARVGAHGAYQGAWGLVFALGYGGALLFSGLLVPVVGWRATWGIAAVVAVACAAALFLLRGTFRRTTDSRAQA